MLRGFIENIFLLNS